MFSRLRVLVSNLTVKMTVSAVAKMKQNLPPMFVASFKYCKVTTSEVIIIHCYPGNGKYDIYRLSCACYKSAISWKIGFG